jgi:O-methyltransferase
MRLDGDLYDSTRDALNLCDRLSRGGYVIIDDYGELDVLSTRGR